MRLLITGAAGMLGQDVVSAASGAGLDCVALSRAELDISDGAAVRSAVRRARPEVIVNCAAWTDVDGAESSPDAAISVNRVGAGNVARAAFETGAWTVHISTDYVFEGAKREPYVESDPVAPLSIYGRSKLEGELAVAHECPERHTIVRSSWLFGAGGPCFPATILRLAAQRDELTVVDDQTGCPTFTGHLARALVELAADAEPPVGIIHIAGGGACTWFAFAHEIVRSAGISCEIKPGRTTDLGRPAPRPAYSVLGTERAGEIPPLPNWREGLADYLTARVQAP
jgi:dTDP-4-dehydrorhamnose reductase